jgi:hypothetical protein
MPSRPWIPVLALLPLLLAVAPATQPSETKPDWIIKVKPGTQLLEWDEDGRGMYLLSRVKRVNLWVVGVYYWPEGAGAVIGLLALRWLVRDWRRKRVAGEEYCRRCNYMLRGLLAGRCPECGVELSGRNRVGGGGRRWRLLAEVMVLAAVGVGYGVGRDRLPRVRRVGEWFQWRSEGLADWAEAGQHDWLTRHAREQDELVLTDATGAATPKRVCWIEMIDLQSPCYWIYSQNGHRLVQACFLGPGETGVIGFDARSGKVLSRWTLPFGREHLMVGPGSSDLLVALGFGMSVPVPNRAFDLTSGKPLGQLAGRPNIQVQGFLDHRVIILDESSPLTLSLWDPRRSSTEKKIQWNDARTWFIADGKVFVVRNGLESHVATWDLASGNYLGYVDLGKDVEIERILEVRSGRLLGRTSEDRNLVINDGLDSVSVYDLQRHHWVARIEAPGSDVWYALSPDGRKVLALSAMNLRMFLIYDLDSLQREQGN